MTRAKLGTTLAITSIIFIAAGTTGCASTGSGAGDAGVGAGIGALGGAIIGGVIGGEKGALIGAGIGAGAGALVGLINYDQFKQRQATQAEADQARMNSSNAIAEAKRTSGDKYDQVDEVWTVVDENEETVTMAAIDPNTGTPTGEVIDAPAEDVATIKSKNGGVINASDDVTIPAVGGKTVVITS